MKNIIKSFLLFSIMIALNGCEDYENVTFNGGNGYIQLENEAPISVVENNTSDIEINYILDSPKTSAVTVEVMVSSDDNSRYEIVSGTSLSIAPGDTMATFVIRPVNNFETDGNIDVDVSLSESSSLPIGIGGQSLNAVTRTITIADDDCPFRVSDWVGTYSVDEVITDGPNTGVSLAGAFGETYIIEVTLDPSDNTGSRVVLNNQVGANTYLPNGTIFTFLSCDGAVSMSPSPQVVAEFTTWSIGTSSYNESNFTITAEGPLGASRMYEMVLTKQ